MTKDIRTLKNQFVQELADYASANSNWFFEYMRWNYSRIYDDAVFISKHVPRKASVLDLGAVPPLLLGFLSKSGYESLEAADPKAGVFSNFFKAKGIKFSEVDIIRSPKNRPGRVFDCVIMAEVIEHLSGNLISSLEGVSDWLSSGGYLYLTTPNLRSISGIIGLFYFQSGLATKPSESVRAQFDREGSDCGYFGHVREYTSFEIVNLVESVGFKLIQKEMKPVYSRQRKWQKAVGFCEEFIPSWRSFGKYLFQKT